MYSCRQSRLHELAVGDRLWLVSRCPDDNQYRFVAALTISGLQRNAPASSAYDIFGEFAVVADRSRSHDLGRRFPAEGLLRAFEFETRRPVRFGSSLGQSLQAIRFATSAEERVLDAGLHRILRDEHRWLDAPFGLWTKCDRVFADYFLKNWQVRGAPLAFLLYDSLPALAAGSAVFIHSDKTLRLVGRFVESQFVSGHKHTVEADERRMERDRVWDTWRATTIDPPTLDEFAAFWDAQNGVRGLFVVDNLVELAGELDFKTYGRALEWGFPMGVGYRYLTLSQSLLLLHGTDQSEHMIDTYILPQLNLRTRLA